MKRLQLPALLLLLVSFFSFSKCNKEPLPPQLPAETQTGANTFGCKLNGVVYTPRGTITCYKFLIQYYKSDSALLIKTNDGCSEGVNIYIYGINETKDYQIFSPIKNAFLYTNSNPICNWFDRANSS
ncbi:MAG: hypothetical protein K2Q24_14235 [Chitinophagaceae bacterium]|nr:hypothetical protein [Chitinophagaceae bacterium]